jgi:hypothetical protein
MTIKEIRTFTRSFLQTVWDPERDLVSLGEWRKKAAVVCAEFVGKSC